LIKQKIYGTNVVPLILIVQNQKFKQGSIILMHLEEVLKFFNRIGVRAVNDYLSTYFERGNDLFDGMAIAISKYKPKSKRIEEIVRDAINNSFDGFIHNKVMNNAGDYHYRRIDHRVQIGNTILAIETDENAHQYYKEHDEQKRYDEFVSFFPYNFVFIRFNPDDNMESIGMKTTVEYKIGVLIDTISYQIDRIRACHNLSKLEVFWLFY